MVRDSYVMNVYEKICEKFCENIPAEMKDSVTKKYTEYLRKTYDAYFSKASDEGLPQEAAFCAKKESVVNLKKSCDEKIAWLFPDEQYLKLESLSLEICSYVREKISLSEIKRTKEDFLSELDELYKSVSSQFKYSADRMYSEALLDLESLFGNSETISLRNAIYKES